MMSRTLLAMAVVLMVGSAHADGTPRAEATAADALGAPQAKYVTIGGQVKDDLLPGTDTFAQGATKVTEINLDPSTMGMLGNGHGPHADAARKLDLMVIRTYSYDKPGMYRAEDVEAIHKKLQEGNWNCSIRIREKDKVTDICSRAGADHATNEMVMFTAAPQKITYIHMSGKMSLSELDQMGGGAVIIPHPPVPPIPPIHPQVMVSPPEPPAVPPSLP